MAFYFMLLIVKDIITIFKQSDECIYIPKLNNFNNTL